MEFKFAYSWSDYTKISSICKKIVYERDLTWIKAVGSTDMSEAVHTFQSSIFSKYTYFRELK